MEKKLVMVVEMSVDPNVDIDFTQLVKDLLEANGSISLASVEYAAELA